MTFEDFVHRISTDERLADRFLRDPDGVAESMDLCLESGQLESLTHALRGETGSAESVDPQIDWFALQFPGVEAGEIDWFAHQLKPSRK
jgi:hypothetical protein